VKAGGVVDPVQKTVSVTVNHFSTYRIMADKTPVPERIAGTDRYDTAVQIAGNFFPDGADTVILVRGDLSADALTAVPLPDTIMLLCFCLPRMNCPRKYSRELSVWKLRMSSSWVEKERSAVILPIL
jgi:hypothetical protein